MTKTKTSLFILLISVQTQAQTTSVQRRDNKPNFRSELMHSELLKPQYDYSILLQKTDTTRYPKKHMGAMPNDKEVFYNYGQNDPPFNNFNDGSEASLKAITPSIGINFGANNLAKGKGVSDNTLSISNGGYIFSADNSTVDVYTEAPDTIQQFTQEWSAFETNPSLLIFGDGFSDPRSIYDLQNDRFINVIQNQGTFNESSKAVISFSQTPNPAGNWNHYEIKCDSIFPGMGYWFDYPNIAVNNADLYVSFNVFQGSIFVNNVVFQIIKSNGFNGQLLDFVTFTDLRNTSNSTQFTLVPLSHAMQDNNYGTDMYFVSNDAANSDSLYWTKLIGYPDPGDQVIFTYSLATVPYKSYSYASQPGGLAGDRINTGNCRVQSGYFQNGKLHFVYTRSNSTWGQIVYSKINITTNTEQRATYGAGAPNNYCFPSIAHFGSSNTQENAMICFLKVGTSTFPTIGAINHDAGGFGAGVTVKAGLGLLNLQEFDGTALSYERLGDYTSIQRKYNEPQPTCWLSGGYAFGNSPNFFLQIDGLNTWIAEIGNVGVGLTEQESIKFKAYPNPIHSHELLKLQFNDIAKKTISICDILGQQILNFVCESKEIELPVSILSSGTYLIQVQSKSVNYETTIFNKL